MIVDLVMMSKASTPALAAMTQHAIDTAKRGAPNHDVRVIVMEQTDWAHVNAQTVRVPGTFNYNAFANRGIGMGNAQSIVVANNDLIFEGGWLDALLDVNYPVVSPLSPGYHRHVGVVSNEFGWQVGRHFAGWCFMLSRWLWNKIGGLDETYPFWCADNAVVNQLRERDVHPMLVCEAIVHHRVSATLSGEDATTQDDLTWAALHNYNRARGENHLADDRRYIRWQRRNGISV